VIEILSELIIWTAAQKVYWTLVRTLSLDLSGKLEFVYES